MKNIYSGGIILSLLLQSMPMNASTKQQIGFQSFIQWCQQRSSIPKATRHTVNMIMKEYRTNNCQVANRQLKSSSSLGLTNKKITDLRPLANLSGLLSLSLDDNQITDITPLTTLTGLRYLNLRNNQISNLKPLANLTRLSGISLKNNQISDLSPLVKLTKLRTIYLTNNQISDLNPLANLDRLFRIEVSGNQVSEKDCPIPQKYCNFDIKKQWNWTIKSSNRSGSTRLKMWVKRSPVSSTDASSIQISGASGSGGSL